MSRIHEALRKSELENRQAVVAAAEAPEPTQAARSVLVQPSLTVSTPAELSLTRSVGLSVSSEKRLVALTDPRGLGAEKFRVLATRLENMRKNAALKSLQITSGSNNEGKTVISANLALTFAKRSSSKVLLIEGDLHKPALASIFGLERQQGLVHWWSEPSADIGRFIHKVNDIPLWVLGAGKVCAQPSDILQSAQFAAAFSQLTRGFDWIVVDSTPLQPMADVNLWSRWVDGMLLVVREGMASVEALKKGLASLDNPKLVGVVLNEASELDQINYYRTDESHGNNGKESRPQESAPEVVA